MQSKSNNNTKYDFPLLRIHSYFYMYSRKNSLRHALGSWKKTVRFPDKNLRKYINAVTICIFTSAILENAVGHVRLFSAVEPSKMINCTTATIKDQSSLSVGKFIKITGILS